MSYTTPEGKVKKQGRDTCRKLGLYSFPVNQGGFGVNGIPDDMVNAWGLFLQIEYKHHMRWDKRNKAAFATLPTMKQIIQMENSRKGGGITWVVDDMNIDRLECSLLILQNSVSCVDGCKLTVDEIQHIGQKLPVSWNWTFEEYTAYQEGKGVLYYDTPKTPIPVLVGYK